MIYTTLRINQPTHFEIKHDEQECLVSVEGYYDEATRVIQGLQFKTNMNTSKLMGYNKGKKFSISANGMKIIGFHGYADKNLSSLGAYFTTLSPMKFECQGATKGGDLWDDGAFEGVRKVYVYYEHNYIMFISFDYQNDGQAESMTMDIMMDSLDKKPSLWSTIQMSISLLWRGLSVPRVMWITTLTFKTSQGRISQKFGNERLGDQRILLESKDCALVGFHGQSDDSVLLAIGAYFYPMQQPSPDAKKLEAKGGWRSVKLDKLEDR
ncbi:unnamed protein product [Thlaspi arvense]|uniref:Jacalin-type lectin domain-containing protein n=1 Tax=Thlaspi arvense TaxID=13288 RepID=A0AAU9RCT6_THLAR|nr:unnamed protein product [Thlaspi arvense]